MHGFEARLDRHISEQALRVMKDMKADAAAFVATTAVAELLNSPSYALAAAMGGALTLLLACAIQTATGTALDSGGRHSIQHELGRVPTSRDYRQVQELADWDL